MAPNAAAARTIGDFGWWVAPIKHPSRPTRLAREYRIDGIPTCLIVDREGTIVYRGAPQNTDIAATVDRLVRADVDVVD